MGERCVQRAVIVVMAACLSVVAFAQAPGDSAAAGYMERVEVSLLTCSPHDEVYALYGHTALRCRVSGTSDDWVFSYGVFNFNVPFFALRFALGKTDYELGVLPYSAFRQEYVSLGCTVREQVLNLTPEEKSRVLTMLYDNYLPENRVYRYNFFYNNCTTKARDVIENSIGGRVVYDETGYAGQTMREALHVFTAGHPWAELGDDIALGAGADMPLTHRERQFLPRYLMEDFDKAKIYSGGEYRPLVRSARVIVAGRETAEGGAYIARPLTFAVILLLVSLAVAVVERRRGMLCRAWDIVLMGATGIAGVVVLLLFFSEHPSSNTNIQVLLLNPLSLVFIPAVARGRGRAYWKMMTVLLALFLAGGVFQDYGEGMELVCLSMLTRCVMHLRPQGTMGRVDTDKKTMRKE